jgi:murein DD-endopeptidase MepM/ murein hydrolase activator NlpD
MTDTRGEQPSFDPRRWHRATTPPGARPIARPAAPTSSSANATGTARPPGWALAGSAAILAAGALAAHLSHPAPGVPPATPASTTVAPPRDERRMLVLSSRSDLAGALVSSGVDPRSARDAAAAATPALKPAGEVRAAMTLAPHAGGADLVRLEASNDDASGVIVARGPAGFIATPVAADLSSRVVVRRGTMDADSFYSSAVASGVIDSLIPDFAAALSYDFDFQREVHKGDAFEAAFEQRTDRDGRVVGPPTLLYAALTTRGKQAAAYRFAPPGEQAGWFDGDGRSVKRALLRTPVDAARVSSGFGYRLHPILGFMKLHKGTDFAAPVGTPIFASGDATVEFAGPKGPNGNFVKLMHDNGWESLYLHMSMFAPGMVAGARVRQGQQIGAVGTTGRSTGPHLHYELHVGGEPVDPLSVRTETEKRLTGAALAAFRRERGRIDVNRARAPA